MNILFIAPQFYSYHTTIKEALERKGHFVKYFDDRPGTDFLTKSMMRINKKILKRKCEKYFKQILDSTLDYDFDLVFVIYGQCLNKNMVSELRARLNNAKFVFYMYDPISSMPDRVEFAELFDFKYSFDYADIKKYPQFKLLPLFFSKKQFPTNDIIYEACFVGTMMPGKYEFVRKVINCFLNKGKAVKSYQYIQSKIVAVFYKVFYKDFRKAKLSSFETKRISQSEVDDIISKSKYIIDCPKQNQTGLTIRIFESLHAKRKIITPNESVINYPFYSKNNFYICKDGIIDFDDDFFKTEFEEIDEQIMANYDIDNWVNNILEV